MLQHRTVSWNAAFGSEMVLISFDTEQTVGQMTLIDTAGLSPSLIRIRWLSAFACACVRACVCVQLVLLLSLGEAMVS